MRKYSAAACVLILAAGARAQLFVPRIDAAPSALAAVGFSGGAASAIGSPAYIAPALSIAPALQSPALASAPSLLAAAPALAAASFPSAKSGEEKEPAPSGEHAAAALSEFSRLVADLMGANAAKSAAAAAELVKLKDAHLNQNPEPKRVRILDLKPMQIPVGMFEVQDKARALRDMKSKDADDWLRDKSVPNVEDIEERKRPVDHHHEARSAWEADIEEGYTHRYFDDKLHALIKKLPLDAFYAVTRAMGLFYDRDQFGAGPHDPNHLPEDVRGLADDPFRSIAWQVRKRGGYDKSSLPFAEFQWARYFRERLKTYPNRADFEKAVAEAMKIVHDPAAKGLPGYKPK